jgi:hypothetical protein
MIAPILLTTLTAIIGLSFIFGVSAAVRYTAAIIAAVAGIWLAFVIAA